MNTTTHWSTESIAVQIVDLLESLQTMCPSCLLSIQNRAGQQEILLRVSPTAQDALLTLCQRLLLIAEPPPQAYAIDMHHIDLITPTAAHALLIWIEELKSTRQAAILLTHVRPEVIQGLLTMQVHRRVPTAIWAVSDMGQPHMIGSLPHRLQEIMPMLLTKGEVCARDLAAAMSHNTSKQTVNRFSVYLQELVATGLVVREKVSASSSGQSTRGWTYHYRPVSTFAL